MRFMNTQAVSRNLSFRTRAAALCLSMLLLASPALAHGEEILLVPIGQLVSLVALTVVVFVVRSISLPRRILGLILALVVCISVWCGLGDFFFPPVFGSSTWGLFLSGLLPPLAAWALIVGITSFKPARRSDANEAKVATETSEGPDS